MIRSILASTIALALWASAASAATVTYDIADVTVSGSTLVATTGTLDITFSGAAGVSVGGYDLDVMAPSAVTLTGYTPVAPFANVDMNDFTAFGGGEYGVSVTLLSAYPVMDASNVVGRFSYSVAANTFGTFNLTWENSFTSGQEGSGSAYDLAFNAGSITVNEVISEPVPLPLAAWGGLALFGLMGARKWRKGRTPQTA